MWEVGYDGDVSIEYSWLEWERMNELDVLSETMLMRIVLSAVKMALARYPEIPGISTPIADDTTV